MEDVPRRVRVTMNCPHCGHDTDADPEFVQALIASAKIREVEVHVQAAHRRHARSRRGTAMMFFFVAFWPFVSAISAWFWPGVVEPRDLVVCNLLAAATAVAAGYAALTLP